MPLHSRASHNTHARARRQEQREGIVPGLRQASDRPALAAAAGDVAPCHNCGMRSRAAPLLGLAALVVLCACRQSQPVASKATEDWSGFGDLENVLNWTPEQQLRGFRNMDRIYPTRLVRASSRPFPLPDQAADFSGLRYTVDANAFDVNAFVSHNHIVGLLAIRDGNVVLERYAEGNARNTRWYSFSVAKSVVSMLVGAAVKDGFIPSIDVPVSNFLPLLRGSAYEQVTLRQAMTMSSGVAWNEDYADPQSDIARTSGSSLDRLRYLLRKPRVAPPGSTFNYNTEETNLVGAVMRAAIGNNLAMAYLDDKIWRRFGWSTTPIGCCYPSRAPSTVAAA